MKTIELTKGLVAKVSDEDFMILAAFKWCATNCKQRSRGAVDKFYACRHERGKKIYMHRLILDAPAGMVVDHLDGDGLNNQRENLRLVTADENNAHNRFKKKTEECYL